MLIDVGVSRVCESMWSDVGASVGAASETVAAWTFTWTLVRPNHVYPYP